MIRVGLLLRRAAAYSELLATSAATQVTVRSSDYSRTLHTAAALLYALGSTSVLFIITARGNDGSIVFSIDAKSFSLLTR